MTKIIIAFAVLMQFYALLSMPKACFTVRHAVTCERVQISGWINRYDVNWGRVEAIQNFDG